MELPWTSWDSTECPQCVHHGNFVWAKTENSTESDGVSHGLLELQYDNEVKIHANSMIQCWG